MDLLVRTKGLNALLLSIKIKSQKSHLSLLVAYLNYVNLENHAKIKAPLVCSNIILKLMKSVHMDWTVRTKEPTAHLWFIIPKLYWTKRIKSLLGAYHNFVSLEKNAKHKALAASSCITRKFMKNVHMDRIAKTKGTALSWFIIQVLLHQNHLPLITKNLQLVSTNCVNSEKNAKHKAQHVASSTTHLLLIHVLTA